MKPDTRFSIWRVTATLLLVIVSLGILYKYGRSIWHPIVVRTAGEKTIADRMNEIEVRHPDLRDLHIESVHIAAIKDPGYLQVYINKKPWRTFPLTANSGTLGPKYTSGDGQIPEGFYHIDAVNPNSSYHLSLRVSYPNTEDKTRSSKAGIEDLGGDIYIHGKDASIGCLAIGDTAIEQLFYVVNKIDIYDVEVMICPVDLTSSEISSTDHADLYDRLKAALLNYKKWH